MEKLEQSVEKIVHTYNNGGKIVQKLGSYKTSKWQKDSKIFKITRFEIVKKIEEIVVQNLYKNYFKDCEKIVKKLWKGNFKTFCYYNIALKNCYMISQ